MGTSNFSEYIDSLIPFAQGALGELQKNAYAENLPIIDKDAAAFLSALIRIKRPARILEIGCAIGFSAALMAENMPAESHIVTIDRYEYMIAHAKGNFSKLGIENKIRLIEADAKVALQQLIDEGNLFDFVFLDAGKGQYNGMISQILQLLANRGVLLADDIFQKGKISLEITDIEKRQRTTYRNMRSFLERIFADESLVSSILPLADGMLLSVKKG